MIVNLTYDVFKKKKKIVILFEKRNIINKPITK